MHVRVKICGVTTGDAVDAAVEHGADAIGFVFSASPRQVSVGDAIALSRRIPAFVMRVAVFARPRLEDVVPVLESFRPDVIQVDEDAAGQMRWVVRERVMPVFRDRTGLLDRIRCLLDHAPSPIGIVIDGAESGSGRAADWSVASEAARLAPLVLAGGLHPGNVAQAIRTVRPFAVDVSSGVESSPGRKDPARIAAFLAAVRAEEDRA